MTGVEPMWQGVVYNFETRHLEDVPDTVHIDELIRWIDMALAAEQKRKHRDNNTISSLQVES